MRLTLFKAVITIHYKMINLDIIANENNKEHNKKLPYIPDHQYKILIIGGYWSGKANALLNLIKEQDDIDKIYLYAKMQVNTSMGFWLKSVRMLE